MLINYRDELGYVVEEIDENGISFVDGVAYFNDKKVNCNDIQFINVN